MTTLDELQPGDFGVTPTYGNWSDRFIGWAIRYGTGSPVNHAVLYLGDGKLIEARPGGAGINNWDAYGSNMIWSAGRLPTGLVPTQQQRNSIAAFGETLVGRPYGWVDIFAIAIAQKRLGEQKIASNWIANHIKNTKSLICSQLVDLAYYQTGVHLFDDGRLPGLVSPGDLDNLLLPVA